MVGESLKVMHRVVGEEPAFALHFAVRRKVFFPNTVVWKFQSGNQRYSLNNVDFFHMPHNNVVIFISIAQSQFPHMPRIRIDLFVQNVRAVYSCNSYYLFILLIATLFNVK